MDQPWHGRPDAGSGFGSSRVADALARISPPSNHGYAGPAMDPHTLRTMPLHAITELYGEEGLRLRVEVETQRLDEDARRVLADALSLATELHRDDRRTREPYVNHLLRCAIRVLVYYHVDDAEVIAATLLHDSVEDHAPELAPNAGSADPTEAALAVLAERFGPRV